MQATIHRYDELTHDGSVLADDGRELRFDATVFTAGGLRHVRVGQRVSIEAEGTTVTRLWIVGVGPGQPIH